MDSRKYFEERQRRSSDKLMVEEDSSPFCKGATLIVPPRAGQL